MTRTLPLRVAPVPGEALDSWLEALAARHATPLGDLIGAVGLAGVTYAPWMLIHLTDRQREDVAYATGIDAAAITATTLDHFDGRAVDIDHTGRRLDHAFPFGCRAWSRYCPACLAESDGRWLLQWRFGWVFACTRHRCLLVDHCPQCGRQQRKTRQRYSTLPQPRCCGGTAGLACGADLAHVPLTRFPARHAVLDAQDILLRVIADDRADFGVYAAYPCRARTALADLKALTCRMLAYAADHGRAALLPKTRLPDLVKDETSTPVCWRHRRDRPQLNAPQIAADAAVAITAALAVLQANDIASASEQVRWLVAGQLRRGTSNALASCSREAGTASAVLLKAFGPPAGSALTGPTMQLRYRTALPVPCPPEVGRHRLRRIAPTLPSLLWPEWSIRLSVRPTHQQSMRIVLACAVLLVGTTSNTSEAATILGDVIDGLSVHNALAFLQRDCHWAGVCAAVSRLSDYLNDHRGPIDYARRRRIDYGTLLPEHRWRQICRHTGTLPGKGQGQKALVARGFLYEKISGIPARRLLIATTRSSELLEQLVRRTADFPRRMTPELAHLLNDEARRFLHTHHVEEPLTWSPPLALISDLDLPHPDPADTDIAELHRLAVDSRLTIGQTADALHISTPTVRHLLDLHPAERHDAGLGERVRARVCPALTAEHLHDLYVRQGLTLAQIAVQFDTTRYMVGRLAARDGVPIRRRPPAPDADWLYEQHVIKRRTLTDIAAETGVRWGAVCQWKRRHQLASRDDDTYRAQRPMSQRSARTVLQPWFATDRPPDMLTHFASAVDHPTLQTAATNLGINPATLRYRIRAVERVFGAPLLLRARHGLPMRTTPLGERVAEAILIVVEPLHQQQRAPTPTSANVRIPKAPI